MRKEGKMEKYDVERAIREKRLLTFSYGGHRRVVEPHILGRAGGELEMLGFQIAGSSSSGRIPAWRRFVLSRATSAVVNVEGFAGRRWSRSGIQSEWDQKLLVVGP